MIIFFLVILLALLIIFDWLKKFNFLFKILVNKMKGIIFEKLANQASELKSIKDMSKLSINNLKNNE